MALSAQELAAAQKMHASVGAFEKGKGMAGWSSAWFGVIMGLSINARSLWQSHHPTALLVFAGMMATTFLFLLLLRRLARLQYERDKILLQVLEREHADELPWIELARQEAEVKAHLAAVRAIQREVARERMA